MSEILIIKEPISRTDLKKIAEERYGDLVKAAVDTEQGIMAVGGELHIDESIKLVEQESSKHENIWGINIYPEKHGAEFIEFDSMINLKSNLGNRTRNIDNDEIKERVVEIVNVLVK